MHGEGGGILHSYMMIILEWVERSSLYLSPREARRLVIKNVLYIQT